jgi:hypothetical protein
VIFDDGADIGAGHPGNRNPGLQLRLVETGNRIGKKVQDFVISIRNRRFMYSLARGFLYDILR